MIKIGNLLDKFKSNRKEITYWTIFSVIFLTAVTGTINLLVALILLFVHSFLYYTKH